MTRLVHRAHGQFLGGMVVAHVAPYEVWLVPRLVYMGHGWCLSRVHRGYGWCLCCSIGAVVGA